MNSPTAEQRTKEKHSPCTAIISPRGKERPQQAVTGTATMWVRHTHTHTHARTHTHTHTHTHTLSARTYTDTDKAAKQRHQTREILVLTWRAKLDAVLQSAYKVSITQFNDMQAIGFLHVFHPLVGLALGINHQRPPPGITTNTCTHAHTNRHTHTRTHTHTHTHTHTNTVVPDQIVLPRQRRMRHHNSRRACWRTRIEMYRGDEHSLGAQLDSSQLGGTLGAIVL